MGAAPRAGERPQLAPLWHATNQRVVAIDAHEDVLQVEHARQLHWELPAG